MRLSWILAGSLASVVFILGSAIYLSKTPVASVEHQQQDLQTVVSELRDQGFLVAQTATVSATVSIQENRQLFGYDVPLSETEAYYPATGKVSAGVDLSEAIAYLEGNLLIIELPPVEIFSVEEFRDQAAPDVDRGILGTDATELLQQANDEAVANLRDAAIESGILVSAEENAIAFVTEFLGKVVEGDRAVEVRIKEAKE